MEPGAVRERRIHERRGHVQPPAGALQHPLHEVTDLLVRQRHGGQFRFAVARHVDLVRRVEPDFLDARIVQERLKRAKPRHGVEDESPGLLQRADGRKRRQQRPLVVVADRRLHEAADFAALPQWIQAAATDQLTDFVLDDAHSFHGAPNMTATPPPGAVQLGLKLEEPGRSDKGVKRRLWISSRQRARITRLTPARLDSDTSQQKGRKCHS